MNKLKSKEIHIWDKECIEKIKKEPQYLLESKMKPHKWAKEIKAWADGAEIEFRFKDHLGQSWSDWLPATKPNFDAENAQYRIKPQPKDSDYINIAKEHYANLRKYEKKLWEEVCVKVMNDFMDGIKPQPKEPQYLYVYGDDETGKVSMDLMKMSARFGQPYKGKIKLEVDNE
ncbi:hypothetical protein UFOVP250_64 [uncultured Caudovirales phage]|uniref:Uncharacterized protein n=1 Tax=uncultured Caudovirales phage TaxID=2100421 RepID=A0A6J5LI33_9CAUD|nr:hypothetical protein UFOVP250_64 [uncultured Caudovirales phage]